MAKKVKSKIENSSLSMCNVTVDLLSNKEALVCGCRGVIEYNESIVRLNCAELIICFQGVNLSIKALTIEEIIVKGEIIKIEFSNC